VRALLIVILPPAFDFSFGIAQAHEPVRIQAFIAQATVEAFNVSVLHRFAGLDEFLAYVRLTTDARNAGAQDYVLKSQGINDILRGIDTLLAGGTFFGAPSPAMPPKALDSGL